MAQIAPIQSFTFGGPDLNNSKWWTNTSPSRSQMAGAASMGMTGMMTGGQTGNMLGSPMAAPRTGTFSNWATQKALAGQHQGLSNAYAMYHQAMMIGDFGTAEMLENELRKYGYDPLTDQEMYPRRAPLYGAFAPGGAEGIHRSAKPWWEAKAARDAAAGSR